MMQWLSHDGRALDDKSTEFRFAGNFAKEPLRLRLQLAINHPHISEFELKLGSKIDGLRLECPPNESKPSPPPYSVFIVVAPADPSTDDDEIQFDLVAQTSGTALSLLVAPSSRDHTKPRTAETDGTCRIVLRRTRCHIDTTLLSRNKNGERLSEEALIALEHSRAALLWYGWKRYREVVSLKRCTSGLSGSHVFVFRPRLRDPHAHECATAQTAIPGIVSEAWGSCLLVKTGAQPKVKREWDRFRTYLADRQHPFMARCEEYLEVGPASTGTPKTALATVIGSFLGSDLLHVEPFEQVLQTSNEPGAGQTIIERLFAVTAPWYSGAESHPLREWRKMFQFAKAGKLLLFGRFDLTEEQGRNDYAESVAWDISFFRERHLSRHLLGQDQDGLLYKIMNLPVRYSLIHGDLHPRNVLADHDNV